MKLIRDKLAAKITNAPVRRVTDSEEYATLLRAKLFEELYELADSEYKDMREYADVIEVLMALAASHAISESEIHSVRKEKSYTSGAFVEGWVLEADEKEISAYKKDPSSGTGYT